ncbi:hypothetical protein BBP13_12020 [Limosilactobacillus reuteri]|nr:hypothetical protein BBP13_12020 [Limosilactobacillus reuteri]
MVGQVFGVDVHVQVWALAAVDAGGSVVEVAADEFCHGVCVAGGGGSFVGCAVFGGGGHGEVGEGGEKHFAGHSVEIASDGDSSVEGGGDAQFVAVGVFAWWWVVGFEHVLEDADGVAQFDGGCFGSRCCGEECVAAVR